MKTEMTVYGICYDSQGERLFIEYSFDLFHKDVLYSHDENSIKEEVISQIHDLIASRQIDRLIYIGGGHNGGKLERKLASVIRSVSDTLPEDMRLASGQVKRYAMPDRLSNCKSLTNEELYSVFNWNDISTSIGAIG